MKLDLHLHTFRSPDSLSSYRSIIKAVRRRGLDGIAVTDHNTMAGARELARQAPFVVILAEEIRTKEGEIIGYFLQEEIPQGLDLEEAIDRVHEQGGLVAVPHPVDRLRRASAIGESALARVVAQVDMIEGSNGRCLFPADNLRAVQLARAYDKPITAGSDAHSPYEIGRCYTEIEPFEGPAQFLDRLRAGTVRGRHGRPWLPLWSLTAKIVRLARLERWISY